MTAPHTPLRARIGKPAPLGRTVPDSFGTVALVGGDSPAEAARLTRRHQAALEKWANPSAVAGSVPAESAGEPLRLVNVAGDEERVSGVHIPPPGVVNVDPSACDEFREAVTRAEAAWRAHFGERTGPSTPRYCERGHPCACTGATPTASEEPPACEASPLR